MNKLSRSNKPYVPAELSIIEMTTQSQFMAGSGVSEPVSTTATVAKSTYSAPSNSAGLWF